MRALGRVAIGGRARARGAVLGGALTLCAVAAFAQPATPPAPPAPSAVAAPSADASTAAASSDDLAPPPRHSAAWVEAALKSYAESYPELTRLVRIGTSIEGRPLWALGIGRKRPRKASRPTVLLNGAHHGIELLSIDMVFDAIELLLLRSGTPKGKASGPVLRSDPALDRTVQRFLDELYIWCVPVVNPDGVWAALHGNPRTGRKNGRDTNHNHRIDRTDGVDLNRNYPFKWGALGETGSSSKPDNVYYRGAAPASEPETRAMMALGESEHPVASVSFHTGTVALLVPYTIDGVKDPTPNEALTVAEALLAGLPEHPQGKPIGIRRKLYPVDGTDQDYYRAQYGTLALLFEGARRDPKDEVERRAVLHAARPIWIRLFQRFLDGPSLTVRVKDATGKPVVAEVAIAELPAQEGEVYLTRCRDGRFDRYLNGPGRYTVRVRVPGEDAVLEKPVDVGNQHTELEVALETAPKRGRCPKEPR